VGCSLDADDADIDEEGAASRSLIGSPFVVERGWWKPYRLPCGG